MTTKGALFLGNFHLPEPLLLAATLKAIGRVSSPDSDGRRVDRRRCIRGGTATIGLAEYDIGNKMLDSHINVNYATVSLTAEIRCRAPWKHDYNLHQPHGSLEYLAPAEFAACWAASVPALLAATAQAPPPLQPPSGVTQPAH